MKNLPLAEKERESWSDDETFQNFLLTLNKRTIKFMSKLIPETISSPISFPKYISSGIMNHMVSL